MQKLFSKPADAGIQTIAFGMGKTIGDGTLTISGARV
jgi:hypothetical protein